MDANQLFLAVELFGHHFMTGDRSSFNKLIFRTAQDPEADQLALAHYNLHALTLTEKHEKMRTYMHSVNYVWIDGLPIIWLLRLMKFPVLRSWRSTFLDWQHSFFTLANKHKLRIFLLGSAEETINRAKMKLASHYPQISFATHHGYFQNEDEKPHNNSLVIAQINAFRPHILLVGMGMPRQEEWILEARNDLSAKVIMPIGGYFDYIAGKTYTPPRWSGRMGLEWFFRLVSSPVRLGHRYLVEPWSIAYMLYKYKSKRSNEDTDSS